MGQTDPRPIGISATQAFLLALLLGSCGALLTRSHDVSMDPGPTVGLALCVSTMRARYAVVGVLAALLSDIAFHAAGLGGSIFVVSVSLLGLAASRFDANWRKP